MAPTGRQLDRLTRLLTAARGNPFLAAKLADSPCVWDGGPLTPEAFARLPFTTKAELVADQAACPPYGTNATPGARLVRLHQSSGTTTGRPLRWRDTSESWRWLLACWQKSFAMLGLTDADRAFFPFSFGPFLGFWSAFEACTQSGMFALSGGGLGTAARLSAIFDHGVTVVFATPTYAMHLAEQAEALGHDLRASSVRTLVVAGEPGGAIPATRTRIESAWGARVLDHYGLTEVGPVAMEHQDAPGELVVLSDDYVAEVLTPGSADPVSPGEVGELVVTNLGRDATPVVRYRTGDLVREVADPRPLAGWEHCPRLAGGVLGRVDDMIHVRGNNFYPSAVEAILHEIPGVAEYQLEVRRRGALADLTLRVEPRPGHDGAAIARAASEAIRAKLLFRVEVIPCDGLPRFEMKARRVLTIESSDPPPPRRES